MHPINVPWTSPRRRAARGSTSASLLGGAVLLVAGLGFGLLLSSQRAEPQGAYDPPAVPGRTVSRPPPGRPRRGPATTAASSTPAAAPSAAPTPASGHLDSVRSTESAATTTTAPPIDSGAVPPPGSPEAFAVPPVEAPRVPSVPTVPVPPTAPLGTSPFAANEVGIRVTGASSASDAEAANVLLRARPSASGAVIRFVPSDAAAPPTDGARVVIAVEATGLRVGLVSAPPIESDVIAALLPPFGLVGEALSGFLLPVRPAIRTASLAALGALVAGDPDASLALLDGAGTDVGVRVITAYARLLRKELRAVHEGVLGLGTDADVGPVARFLTGAALLVDRNAREAARDLAAAVVVRPGYWPARLLAATADERLALPEAARDQFAAVLAAAPGRPEAVIGYATHLAETDRAAAIVLVETCLAERPALVPAWWQLAWLRRMGDTSEDLQKGVEAIEKIVALRPDDAEAWGALGGARWRWAGAAGGVEAYSAASAAFARQCELTPAVGLAWFSQAATLHEVLLKSPLDGDATVLPGRVAATVKLYGKALARGLLPSDLARVYFNLGLLLETVPAWPEGAAPPDAPRKAADAFAKALDADSTYAEAALKLLAARIADRDVKEAAKTLSALPSGIDARERAVLEAALAHAKGDPAGAVRLLTGPARVVVSGSDPLTPLARELLLLGYRRLVVSLLGSETSDPLRIAIRARARAGLGDVEGAKSDLATLAERDAARADDLRRNDPDVRRALGTPR